MLTPKQVKMLFFRGGYSAHEKGVIGVAAVVLIHTRKEVRNQISLVLSKTASWPNSW